MIEFVGADTKFHSPPPVRIGECTPSNPSGKTPADIPQLIPSDGNTHTVDQAIELQMWLGLPSGIALGLIPMVIGPWVTQIIGASAIKTIKATTAVAVPVIIASSYSNKSSTEKSDKEARVKEYREKLEQVIEKQEINDRKFGGPTMVA
ncbi:MULTISPECIES: hypothetical protein [Gammaproteobacteria]|uniref:hypothetical protein n=1 Tax=Gammaproteobacteria TaxID=1236 RepID=UPI001913C1DD|nr:MULTISPECIES: hypothetical protein [Gammaproteobacteria]MBK5300519.1 hypothetical protein [Bacillus sp. TH86]MBK5320288.1 hypothetical protein [Bacillus sp. TH59]MBK5335238.1 hypothetical protein [Bacillus sp. TH57]MBK5309326.1 hypothetical protein [Pseudomonas sp. TH71]MBK5314787.1 hypothetical protein [Erwinia sp. TH79]